MISRRSFTALLAGTVAAPKRAWSQQVIAKTVFYASTGPELTLFDVDVADAALQKRSTVTLPANVQYAWPHPSKRWLYVVSSSGGPGVAGTTHLEHFPSALNRKDSQPLSPRRIWGKIESPGELNRCRGRIPRTCVSVRLKQLKAERRGGR